MLLSANGKPTAEATLYPTVCQQIGVCLASALERTVLLAHSESFFSWSILAANVNIVRDFFYFSVIIFYFSQWEIPIIMLVCELLLCKYVYYYGNVRTGEDDTLKAAQQSNKEIQMIFLMHCAADN